MTESGFSAEENALKTGADHVATTKEDLDTQLTALRNQLTALQGRWKGQGNLAFTNVMSRWDSQAFKLIGVLDVFEANLRGTDKAYLETDDGSAAALNQFDSSLGYSA